MGVPVIQAAPLPARVKNPQPSYSANTDNLVYLDKAAEEMLIIKWSMRTNTNFKKSQARPYKKRCIARTCTQQTVDHENQNKIIPVVTNILSNMVIINHLVLCTTGKGSAITAEDKWVRAYKK